MKTQTKSRIFRIIRKRDGTRPIELVKKLRITAQAIHRHLRSLTTSGKIEARGRGPKTRYYVAGAPCLDKAFRWCASIRKPAENPGEFLCETRDIFTARLGHIGSLTKAGLKEEELPLVISMAGEIGNNCFDHNLGNWRDVPGCWFETQATAGRLWICIGDRGQGVFRSLARVDPSIPDEQAALVTAFEKILSGRFPENRGNGLKFVRNIIVAGEKRGLACRSGAGLVDYGPLGGDCRVELARDPHHPVGTVTLILWGFK